MDDVTDKFTELVIDAVPHMLPVNIVENISSKKVPFESILDEFSVEDYKSAFFLLMDFVGLNNFLTLTKKDKAALKDELFQLYHEYFNDDKILVELLGTLKMYKKLKKFSICHHVYENHQEDFNQIDKIWKILYKLCEELTDVDVENLKQSTVEASNIKDQILSAEDWFCWALQEEIFSRTNLANLETVFRTYPNCLNIIKSVNDFGSYHIKIPSASSDCGIALILNYDRFSENCALDNRNNSDKDVASLEELWETFGFKTVVRTNLDKSMTLQQVKSYASKDHSNYDAFVCCILSHGQSDSIYSSDGELIPIVELIAPIFNECSSLKKKPKLFFIQACQGANIHQGPGEPVYKIKTPDSPVINSSNTPVPPPPILSDVLIVNSSIDGYVSFRGKDGSWFIQSLCKLMQQYGDIYSVEEIMIKVNDEVSKHSANLGPGGPTKAIQIVSRKSTLRKKLILKKRIS